MHLTVEQEKQVEKIISEKYAQHLRTTGLLPTTLEGEKFVQEAFKELGITWED